MRYFVVLCVFLGTIFGQNLPFDLYKKGTNDGDTLLVIGGIHGDEPGGYFAASILQTHYTITKGNLWVIPNTNFESLLRNRRGIYGDMNRKFHHIDKDDKDYEDVTRIKQIMLEDEVDLILNLHDGRGFYRHNWENSIFNPAAWGQAFIIDQEVLNTTKTKYNNLDELAKLVSENLNEELIENHHTFNIKNTQTKDKDEQMKLSLTYFAIKNHKPAFAVETSKNLTQLVQKVKYQLKAIESFMDIMKIEYKREFDINNLSELEAVINDFQKITINDVIALDLNSIRGHLYYFPLKKQSNEFVFSHPLGSVLKYDKRYDIMIGNKRVGALYPQQFSYDEKNKNDLITIEYDETSTQVPFGTTLEVKNHFTIKADEKYRVNVIGFAKDGVENENDIKVEYKEFLKRFSTDPHNSTFRVEFYRDGMFVGTILVKFTL